MEEKQQQAQQKEKAQIVHAVIAISNPRRTDASSTILQESKSQKGNEK
jgi:hypothetical protein